MAQAARAVLRRGKYSRFSLCIRNEDRARLDALKAHYEARIGCRISLSIVLSLMLRELRPETSA